MEHSTGVFRNRFTLRKNNRALILAATCVVGLLVVLGTIFSGAPVAGTQTKAASAFEGGATPEMLDFALNFHDASDFAVFGGRAVRNSGNSTFRGRVGSEGPVTGVPGMPDGITPENRGQARKDLRDA